jgi:hypothetical protein
MTTYPLSGTHVECEGLDKAVTALRNFEARAAVQTAEGYEVEFSFAVTSLQGIAHVKNPHP